MKIRFSDFDSSPVSEVDFCTDHETRRRISLRVDDGSGETKHGFVVYASYFFPEYEVVLGIFPFTVEGLHAAVACAHSECPDWIRPTLQEKDEVVA